jgi:hypothetical protein
VDRREGDLRPLPAVEIEKRFAASGAIVQPTASADSFLPLQGRPLWGTLFAAALAFIAVELFLLGLWRR